MGVLAWGRLLWAGSAVRGAFFLPVSGSVIERNLNRIRERMAAAAHRAGRNPESVRLVAVTKSVGIEEIRTLADLGVTDFGENRTDVARAKMQAVDRPVRWHMIGSVQRRKARDVAALFDYVHSVDRLELGEALERAAAERGRALDALVEINVSGEESKHGLPPESVAGALEALARLPHLRIRGLMTMAPLVEDPEAARPVFRSLRRIADEAGLTELSMGMSNDYEVAVEEGSTWVRIGTALFQ